MSDGKSNLTFFFSFFYVSYYQPECKNKRDKKSIKPFMKEIYQLFQPRNKKVVLLAPAKEMPMVTFLGMSTLAT